MQILNTTLQLDGCRLILTTFDITTGLWNIPPQQVRKRQQSTTNKAKRSTQILAGCGFLWFIKTSTFITHLSSHRLLFDFLLREVFLLDSLILGLVRAELTELHRVVPGTNICVGGLSGDWGWGSESEERNVLWGLPLRTTASRSWCWQGVASSNDLSAFYLDCKVLNDGSHVACFKNPTIASLTNVSKCVLSFWSPCVAAYHQCVASCIQRLHSRQSRKGGPLVTETIRVTFSQVTVVERASSICAHF